MKITASHYEKMQSAITETLAKNPSVAEKYAEAGMSNMRLNWDLLRASKIDGVSGIAWICSNIYPYANDTHIGTALARIVGNDGLNQAGKR